MIELKIPGSKNLHITDLVFDYNGTLAVDGKPQDGLKQKFLNLSKEVNIHVITADTHNNVKNILQDYNCNIAVITGDNQAQKKLDFIKELGLSNTAAFGNGFNDTLMVKQAAIGIAVLLDEGCFSGLILNSDIAVKDINNGIDLFLKPKRLIAGLRNA